MKAMLGTGCAELGEIGAKLRPTWSQVGAKWSQVRDPKGNNVWITFGIDLKVLHMQDRSQDWATLGQLSCGKMKPDWGQVEAKWGQFGA